MLNLLRNNNQYGNFSIPFQPVLMLFIGIITLVLRNPDPIFNPIMLLEDGYWTGLGITNGWMYTFINAKDGYFVWINLLLLLFAERSSAVFCNNSLICLPQAIALFSYIFYSFVAVLAWQVARRMLPTFGAVIIFISLLLIPLGNSSNEIIGRLSNIGYSLVFISVLLVFVRSDLTFLGKLAIDTFLIFCVATNPVCLFIVIMTPVVEYFRYPYTFNLRSMVGDFQVLAIGFIIIVTSMTWRVMHAHGELSNGTFQPDALTEVALARSILYPFIFPWYNNLTDNLTIAISLLFICLCLLMFSLTYSRDVRILIISCFLSFAIFWILTLVMRQNITEYFNEYKSTWPDRYFMGLNYITLFIFTLLAGNLTRYSGFRRLIGVAGLVAVTYIFITKCFWLFEFREPRMNLATGISFREQICLSGLLTNGHAQEYVIVSIHAYGWQMSVPEKIFQDAVSRSDCSAVLQSFFLTDTNWTRGVANIWAGFLMPNTLEYKNALQEGVKLRFANGEVREIVRQEEAGNFLHIFVDGEPLDGKVIGYPYEFEIMP